MGASAKTKSDFKAEIAREQAKIESLKGVLPTAGDKNFVKSQIASHKVRIAELKAQMAKAPKG